MPQDKPYVVQMDEKFAEKIVVKRYGEIPGGFQRELRSEVINKILRKAKAGEVIPPIVIAKIDNEYRLLDGQHRFEAWKQEHFDLFAQVNPIRAQKAVESFCTINGTARRVSLKHQLNVDPHVYAQKVREVSRQFEIDPNVVHATVVRYTNQHSGGRQLSVTNEQWSGIENFLTAWACDKRWKTKGNCYSKYGTIMMAVEIVRKSKDPFKMVELLQKLDFSDSSPLADRYESSASGVRRMADFVMKSLLRKGLLV